MPRTTRISRRAGLGLATALAAVVSLAACASNDRAENNGGGDGDLTPVSFRLNWTWGAEFAPYLVADELGYFEEEGLDVDVMEGEGSAVTATLLGNGEADMGLLAAGETLVAVSRDLPVQAVATTVPNTPTAVIYDTEKLQVDDLTDLYGRPVGVMNESATYKEWQAVTSLNNIDMSQIEEIAVGQAAVQAILTGEVDAIVGLSFNQGLQARVEGGNVEFLPLTELGLEIPQETIAVNTDFAEQEPEAVEAFLRAVKRGWEYTVDDPDAALEMLFEQRPELDEEFNREKLPLVLELLEGMENFGAFEQESWQTLHDIYESQNLLPRPVELDGEVYTTEYLEQ